jgi:hypothetical protein
MGLSSIQYIGRNINTLCDTILNVNDTMPHSLSYAYILSTNNQAFGDTSRYIRVNNLKIYKHS